MGDAGPLEAPVAIEDERFQGLVQDAGAVREIKVLVTGFGPFKSFTTNPSWLIASSLPEFLYPHPISDDPTAPPSNSIQTPCRIRLIVHHTPIRVAYKTVNDLIPSLLSEHDPDYIFHIGMAAGRRFYTLETQAHRDGYRIKDNDDRDARQESDHFSDVEHLPACLRVGWDEQDVLERWEKQAERLAKLAGDDLSKNVVRLSTDAGRFLCEFILFESLSRRWLDVNWGQPFLEKEERETRESRVRSTAVEDEGMETALGKEELALERLGKVAFLHVPGGYEEVDVARGVRIVQAAIASWVESWESGQRRGDHEKDRSKVIGKTSSTGGRWDGVVWRT